MAAEDVWFGNESWPSGRSPGDFARDVFRIEKCRTDKEKALAFYRWFIRCMNRGPNFYRASASGTYERCFDPLTIFLWGSHECTGWGWVAAEALNAAGLKARRVVAHNNGHTFYEVWYRGDDGAEGWHAFDPFASWYFLNAAGEVASCRELAADHTLVQDPFPGHALPCGHTWERSGLAHRHRVEDALEIVQRIKNERASYTILPGQAYSVLWRPADPENALVTYDGSPPGHRGTSQPRGAHCSITPYDHEGRLRYPEHEPYWKNYRWPADTPSSPPVRWHGSGSLRWTPLLHGEKAAEWTAHARFENGALGPDGANRYMEAWYRIKLPYPATHITIDADVRGSGEVGFAVSADEGDTLWSVYRGIPRYFTVTNGKREYLEGKPSVQGLREFLLRIDMLTTVPQQDFVVDGLRILVGFHHNMHIQPRLLPGRNLLYLEAGKVGEGESVSARWNYTTPDGEEEEKIVLGDAGRTTREVHIPCERVEDIVMRGVTVRLRPHAGRSESA